MFASNSLWWNIKPYIWNTAQKLNLCCLLYMRSLRIGLCKKKIRLRRRRRRVMMSKNTRTRFIIFYFFPNNCVRVAQHNTTDIFELNNVIAIYVVLYIYREHKHICTLYIHNKTYVICIYIITRMFFFCSFLSARCVLPCVENAHRGLCVLQRKSGYLFIYDIAFIFRPFYVPDAYVRRAYFLLFLCVCLCGCVYK